MLSIPLMETSDSNIAGEWFGKASIGGNFSLFEINGKRTQVLTGTNSKSQAKISNKATYRTLGRHKPPHS